MTYDCLINGQPDTTVSVADRGLHYGDGLFETLAVRTGRCEFWDDHLERLMAGCRRLGLQPPSAAHLRDEAHRLTTGVVSGVLKIIVTRGCDGRGYKPPEKHIANRILMLSDAPDYPRDHAGQGIQVRLCDLRLAHQPALAGLKHLNRLEQIMARSEWSDPTVPEGLLLDQEDYLIEGTFSNLFLVQDRRLLTPRVDRCGVAGVMRGVIRRLAEQLSIECTECRLTLDDLHRSGEAFITNSLIGIWPIRQCETWQAPVGPVTHALQAALEGLRSQQDASYL